MTKSADILAALAEAPCTAPEIARRLGMDPDAVSATLCVLQRGGRAVRLRGRVRMAGPIPAVRWSLPGPEDIEVAPPRRGEPPPVRVTTFAETLTGLVFGDPPRGYSALDRRAAP